MKEQIVLRKGFQLEDLVQIARHGVGIIRGIHKEDS
jgi:hypothetical protein